MGLLTAPLQFQCRATQTVEHLNALGNRQAANMLNVFVVNPHRLGKIRNSLHGSFTGSIVFRSWESCNRQK